MLVFPRALNTKTWSQGPSFSFPGAADPARLPHRRPGELGEPVGQLGERDDGHAGEQA